MADFSIICCKLEWTFPSRFLCKEELNSTLALTSQWIKGWESMQESQEICICNADLKFPAHL